MASTALTFLSTPPSRVATLAEALSVVFECVSIHATLAGGDILRIARCAPAKMFLSTPPSRVATTRRRRPARKANVSIHATLAGGDL